MEGWKEIEQIVRYTTDGEDYRFHSTRGKLIRCKNCKWWNKQGKASTEGRCELFKIYPTENWYCANGKERQ